MKRSIGLATILVFGLALALALAIASSTFAAPQADPGIHKVYIYNVRDGSFDVSWTTDVASDGTVNYGTSTPPGSSLADSVTNTTTHYVQVTGLSPNTTYYVSVTSDTATDDNGGAYYSVTTGPTLSPPPAGGTVYGVLNESNGTTPIANGIVYIQLQDDNGTGNGNSQWASTRTDGSGNWYYNLPNIRTSDLSAYFTHTRGEDNMRLNFQCGDKGNIGEDGDEYIVTIPAADPGDVGSVSCALPPTAVTLTEFKAENWGDLPLLPIVGVSGLFILAVLFAWRTKKSDPQE